MKSDDFLYALDNGQNVWKKDANGINNGFPLLSWQDESTVSVGSVLQEDKIGLVVSGHNVSASVDGACRIVVTDLSGKTIADKIIENERKMHLAKRRMFIFFFSCVCLVHISPAGMKKIFASIII